MMNRSILTIALWTIICYNLTAQDTFKLLKQVPSFIHVHNSKDCEAQARCYNLENDSELELCFEKFNNSCFGESTQIVKTIINCDDMGVSTKKEYYRINERLWNKLELRNGTLSWTKIKVTNEIIQADTLVQFDPDTYGEHQYIIQYLKVQPLRITKD